MISNPSPSSPVLPVVLHPLFWSRRRITLPGRDPWEMPSTVTAWIQANPRVQIVRTVVQQSSDQSYHCLSMVLLCVVATAA